MQQLLDQCTYFVLYHPEAPFPPLIVTNGLNEIVTRKIRPKDIRYMYLRIGELPEEEVAYPILTARPYEEIRVRDAEGKEPLLEEFLAYL